MSNQWAIQDQNQFPGMIAHSGTAGTAETRRVTADDTGALNVNIVAGDTINVGTLTLGTISMVSAGTITSLGTAVGMGTVSNLGSATHVGQVYNAGTIQNQLGGTLNMLKAGTANIYFMDETGTAAYGIKHISNKPRVSSMSYLYDIAEGNVSGHTSFAKLGYNADVGATEEDIWEQGGVYPWIAAGGTALEVVSDSANDTLAGTGVQKVTVSYLDADYSSQSQTLDMSGTTPVALTDTTILRVNALRVAQVGTGLVAAGNITCRLVGGAATVYRNIVAGYTRGRSLIYTVPLGKTLHITSISVSSGFTTSGKVVRWTGRAQVDDSAPTTKVAWFQPFFEIITEDNNFHRDFEMPFVVPATADLKMSAVSNGAGSYCACALRGWLE